MIAMSLESKSRVSYWRMALLLAAGAGIALRVAFFSVSVDSVPPSSDESIVMLQAADIAGGARPLLFLAQPYMFPTEAYLLAPIIAWLPHNAMGARLHMIGMGLASALFLLLLLRRIVPDRGRLMGAVLILVPSAYLLMLQSAYAPPGYPVMMMLGLMACWSATHVTAVGWRALAWAALAGGLGGLAFAGHLLALPFAFAAALFAIGGAGLRRALPHGLAFAAGASLGAIPYVWARATIPGAHEAVAQHRPWLETLRHLWEPTLQPAFFRALGLEVPPFPDEPPFAILPPALVTTLGALVTAVLALSLLLRAAAVLRGLLRERKLLLHPVDMVLAVCVLNLILYAANLRADTKSIRYAVPAAACVPLLVAWLADRNRWSYRAVSLLAIALLATHLWGAVRLIRTWREPDFAEDVCALPPLRTALAWLEANHIRHVVSSYGAAYRITFESGGRIVAAQPLNERFPGWPVPFKEQVDADPQVAFVLTERIRFLKPSVFERHLRTMRVRCQTVTAGAFRLYHGFRSESGPEHATPLPPASLHIAAQPDRFDPRNLLDANVQSLWSTAVTQQGGEWIEVTWPDTQTLSHATLVYGKDDDDFPGALRVEVRGAEGWRVVEDAWPGGIDKFELREGRPIYGRSVQTIALRGQTATGLRLTVAQPRRHRNWTLADLEIRCEPERK